MRFSLGFSGRNLAHTLSRWGAELRSAFILGDEDFIPRVWNFDLSDIDSIYPWWGVTFSRLNVHSALFLHIGRICWWQMAFEIRGDIDYPGLIIKDIFVGRLPAPMFSFGEYGDLPAFGKCYPWKSSYLGSMNMEVPVQVMRWKDQLLIRPGILFQVWPPPPTLSVFAGNMTTYIEAYGFYFTKDLPAR